MAKRVAKPAKKADVKTLGQMFGDDLQVCFTIASRLARLDGSDLLRGDDRFNIHLTAGNIVQNGEAGFAPGVPIYRIAKPGAPAIP